MYIKYQNKRLFYNYNYKARARTNMWRTLIVPMRLCEILRECAYELDSANQCAAK
jgi:hypothetical protein